MQNRVVERAGVVAPGGAGAGRHRPAEIDRDPADRHPDVARRRYDSLYLSNYATIKLQQEMARLPGVGNVTVFGAGQYAMRIWLDPALMQARGLTPQDVTALQQQSAQVTGRPDRHAAGAGRPGVPIHPQCRGTARRRRRSSSNIIVKTGAHGASPACANRPRGARRPDLRPGLHLDGKPAAGIAVFQSPGANALT